MQWPVFPVVLLGLFLSSCSKQDTASSAKPHATILMRDGTRVTGAVVASSTAEITVAGDDNISRTIPMSQVRSVEYDDSPQAVVTPAQPPASPPPASPPPAAQPPASPPPAARPPIQATSRRPAQTDTTHEAHYHPPQATIRTRTYVVPAGTEIPVRIEETIDSAKAVEGQTYAAELAEDILDAEGSVVIPRGSNAQVVIRSASKGGRFRGTSDLVLDLQSVSVEGQEYGLSTADLEQRGRDGVGGNRRTAEFGGGGAAFGAIIGAIAGGGKGAAIGAGSGAGAGVLTQILTKGGFKLDRPLRVTAAR
jgi:hypothetical protein